MPPQELELEPKFPQDKGRIGLRRDLCEKRSWLLRCIYGAGFVTVTNDVVSASTQIKNEGRSSSAKTSRVRTSEHRDTSTTTFMAKLVVQHWRASCRVTVGLTIRKSSTGTWTGESTKLGMSSSSSETNPMLVGTRGRQKMTGRKEKP